MNRIVLIVNNKSAIKNTQQHATTRNNTQQHATTRNNTQQHANDTPMTRQNEENE